jgi:hypothetical protein
MAVEVGFGVRTKRSIGGCLSSHKAIS